MSGHATLAKSLVNYQFDTSSPPVDYHDRQQWVVRCGGLGRLRFKKAAVPNPLAAVQEYVHIQRRKGIELIVRNERYWGRYPSHGGAYQEHPFLVTDQETREQMPVIATPLSPDTGRDAEREEPCPPPG